jgi:hypothetical protein
MKTIEYISGALLVLFASSALAYGGGSSGQKACSKPKLTQFMPAHLSVVAPQSAFSFLASASTTPSSIQVTVKKLPVDITIEKVSKGHRVTGVLPEALQNTYARINIKATASNRCQGGDGWLLKIEGDT